MERQRWAVNGAGRIGQRLIVQNEILNERNPDRAEGINISHINDPIKDIDRIAAELRHDVVHGDFPGEVIKIGNDCLSIKGRRVKVTRKMEPARAWSGNDGEIFGVLEASGQFTEKSKAATHLHDGVRHVLITAPSKDSELSIVYGINDKQFKGQRVVDNASCTTKSALPVMQTMHREFGIVEADLQTVHSATGPELAEILRQVRGEISHSFREVDWILDQNTGAAANVTRILPELDGRFRARAKRVRSPNGSVSIINMLLEKETNPNEVKAVLIEAAKTYPRDVLCLIPELPITEALRSFNNDAVIPLSRIQGRKLITVESCYNNETGPARNAIQTARLMEDYLLKIM